MGCDVTYEELAAYSAGEAEPDRAAEIERHLPECPACRQRLETLKAVDSTLRLLPRVEPPARAILSTRRRLSHETRGTSESEIMTLDDVAEFLRISPDDFDEVAGDLPAFEIGGQIRVRRSRLLEWIEQRERQYMRSTTQSRAARMLSDTPGKGVA